MGLLFSVKDSLTMPIGSPLQMWVKKYGAASVYKYNLLKAAGDTPVALDFLAENAEKHFVAYIDPENKFKDVDKLSMVQ